MNGSREQEDDVQAPEEITNPDRCYEAGRYLIQGLRRSGMMDLAMKVTLANDAVRTAHRDAQDLAGPVQDRRADRDFSDHLLDDTTRQMRLDLAAAEVGADRKAPYIKIFPNGIDEYTKAKLGDQVGVHSLLCSRAIAHLPAGHTVVLLHVPLIQSELAGWSSSVAALNTAIETLDTGESKLDSAVEAWNQTMLEVFGILLGRIDKSKAERLFSKRVAKKAPKGAPVSAESAPSASAAEQPSEPPAQGAGAESSSQG